jgi:hypothetical protein
LRLCFVLKNKNAAVTYRNYRIRDKPYGQESVYHILGKRLSWSSFWPDGIFFFPPLILNDVLLGVAFD